MFLVNSRSPLVSAATTPFPKQVGISGWPPFSRSYGGILPSSLTTILSITLVFSTRPPVSVIGYGQHTPSRRCFSRQQRITSFPIRVRITSHPKPQTLHKRRATCLHRDNHRTAWLPSCVTPHAHHPSSGSQPPPRFTRRIHEVLVCLALLVRSLTVYRRYGNINWLSIDYACRPRLRSRLTQGGLA